MATLDSMCINSRIINNTNKSMNWENLKKKRCPICGGKLRNNNIFIRHPKWYSKKNGCRFIIRKTRWKELIKTEQG